MPITVPRAKQEVAPSAMPGVRVSTDAPSAAFGLGFSEINQAAQNLFAKEKEKADMAAFYEADLRLAKAQSNLDTQNKAQLKGKNAAGAADNADMALQDTAAEIAKGLSNDNQRSMFERSALQRRSSLYSSLEHHAGEEIYKYNVGVAEASITEYKNWAVQSANRLVMGDEAGADIGVKGIADSFERLESAVRHRAGLDGLDENQTRLLVEQHRSDAIRASIEVLSDNGNDIVAARFREIYKDQIIGEKDTQAVNKAIEVGSIKGVSLRTANALMDQYPDDLSTQLKEARNMFDGGKLSAGAFDMTKSRLEHEYQLQKTQKAQAHDDEFIKHYNAVVKAKDVGVVPVGFSPTPAERNALIAAAKGEEPKSDYKLFTGFMVMPQADKAALTEAELMRKYRPHLEDRLYERVLSEVQAIKDAKGKGDTAHLTSMQSNSDIIQNTYTQLLGKPQKEWGDEDHVRFTRFSDAVSRSVNEYEESKGKKATEKEKQAIVKEVAAQKVTKKGGWWGLAADAELPASTISPEEYQTNKNLTIPMDKIPPEARKNLVDMLRREGLAGRLNDTDAGVLAARGGDIERYYTLVYKGGMSHEGALTAVFGIKGPNGIRRR